MEVLHLFLIATCLLIARSRAHINGTEYINFPAGFKIGVSTSSYQIEGSWDASDKGVNIFDKLLNEKPSLVLDGSNGNVACDSYIKYKEDIALLQELGVDSYRFSLSWSRILPTGYPNKISKDGIQFYKNLLDDLNAVGIEPMVTIYHFDHPALFEEMGGWTNEMMVTWFADYARVVFRELGSRVKLFATINEPPLLCQKLYRDGKKLGEMAMYLCMHNMLKAHARVYRMYQQEFRATQKGQMGVILNCNHAYPKKGNDSTVADVAFDFKCGWLANPIYSKKGDYPESMKKRIAENSKLEGYPRSKLPEFTKAEIELIEGSADYLGLNHYSSRLVESAPKSVNTLWYDDSGVIYSSHPDWPSTHTPWIKIVPTGFGDVLRKLKSSYDNPIVYVTENGVSEDGTTLKDLIRIHYHYDYLREMLVAINRDGCKVQRYYAWSLLDNFEWLAGYTQHFGLVRVDFNSSERLRTPKLSFSWFSDMTRTRVLVRAFDGHENIGN